MQSEHMFLLLSNFTALRLHAQAPCSDDDDDDDDDDDEIEEVQEKTEEALDEEDGEKVNGTRCKSGSEESESKPEARIVDRDDDDEREGVTEERGEQSDEVQDGDVDEQGTSQKDGTDLQDGGMLKTHPLYYDNKNKDNNSSTSFQRINYIMWHFYYISYYVLILSIMWILFCEMWNK